MRKALRRTALLSLGAVAMLGMALPAGAGAATVTLSNDDGIDFANTDPAFHPGDPYPSTVTGPAGTVNDVNVSLTHALANSDEFDIALVSPNGTAVHIQSDACGADASVFHTLTFDDEGASGFLSDNGNCLSANNPYLVSNYEIGDIYSVPGPQAGTQNSLSFFDGGPSGGAWSLFTMDDTGNPPNTGGSISGWSITLDFTPPTPTTTPPGNPASPINPAGNVRVRKCKKKPKKATAAAKKKCKKKKK